MSLVEDFFAVSEKMATLKALLVEAREYVTMLPVRHRIDAALASVAEVAPPRPPGVGVTGMVTSPLLRSADIAAIRARLDEADHEPLEIDTTMRYGGVARGLTRDLRRPAVGPFRAALNALEALLVHPAGGEAALAATKVLEAFWRIGGRSQLGSVFCPLCGLKRTLVAERGHAGCELGDLEVQVAALAADAAGVRP